MVKRAEPGSAGNDLGAAIPVSELQPIVQGLMDDVLAFQRLLVRFSAAAVLLACRLAGILSFVRILAANLFCVRRARAAMPLRRRAPASARYEAFPSTLVPPSPAPLTRWAASHPHAHSWLWLAFAA